MPARLTATLLAAVLLAASPVHAQEEPGNEAEAETSGEEPAGEEPAKQIDEDTQKAITHFKKGVKFFEKGKYEAALVEFLKSHELKPNWALRYNIGVCYEETDHPVSALDQFNLYLAEGGDKVPEERRTEVEAHIEDLEQEMGFLVFDISEVDAQIIVDDFRRFTTPIVDPVPVEAGFHTIEVRKEGFEVHRAKVTVTSGEEVEHKVELVEKEEGGSDEPFTWDEVTPPELPEEEARKPLTGIWIGLGVGGGLAIAAASTGGAVLATKKKMNDASDDCESTMTREDCPTAYEHQDTAEGLKIATNVLWGLAGAAAITGLVVYLTSKPVAPETPEPPEPIVTDVSLYPIIAPGENPTVGIGARLKF